MAEIREAKGHCLCGAVQITAKTMNPHVGACHCNMCTRWAGGPFMAVDCGTDVVFNDEKNIGIINSSDWAERGFCKQCGSNIFYRLKETQQYFISAGIFDELDSLVFKDQVFIDEKPAYYSFANDTHDMTGEEAFAEFQLKNET